MLEILHAYYNDLGVQLVPITKYGNWSMCGCIFLLVAWSMKALVDKCHSSAIMAISDLPIKYA